MHASREEMASLRKAIYPLTRKLAVRLARKRRHGRKGPLDFRNTMRHSLSATAACRPSSSSSTRARRSRRSSWSPTSRARWRRSPGSPSTSSTPSRTSSRRCGRSCSSTASTRSRTCSRASRTSPRPIHRVNTEADVVWVDGHSDYGHAFEVFHQKYAKEVGPKTTVHPPRRRAEQLPRLAVLGGQGPAEPGPPRLLAQPRAEVLLGHRRLASWASTASTATAPSSAATSASSRSSSTTWPSRSRSGAPRPAQSWMPHSVLSWPAQRPERGSLGSVGSWVQGWQPMLR